MKRSDVLTNARYAGQVKRYHTWPTLQEQTTGEHTWQVMRIWCEIWGPPKEVIEWLYLLFHDAGELVTGDLPFPIKKDNPTIKKALDHLEGQALNQFQGLEAGLADSSLAGDPCVKAKICDLLEMWEFGRQELAMGNTYAQPIIEDTRKAVIELAGKLEEADHLRVYHFIVRKDPGELEELETYVRNTRDECE